MDMDGSRPVTASSRKILPGYVWFRVVMAGLEWLQMFLGGWFWVAVDGFVWMQMALGGFKRFSVIYSFSSYGEIRCFKLKRRRQVWEIFVVSSSNYAKVPLKQMTKFLGNSTCHVSLKRPWVGERSFVLWKLTYIALCKFFPFSLRFSPFWEFFSKIPLFGLLFVGRSVF